MRESSRGDVERDLGAAPLDNSLANVENNSAFLMALQVGERIGPYEIVAAIGAGGMGEVYRATDARLKRDVAIKILPDALSQDDDRLDRFKREAELLAALNHPNIAAVYGLEEKDGMGAIVMELIEGPTLAEMIQTKALRLSEALPIARQIADALEAAHEKGVVHRDLKPANIKVTPDGHVKVLDFGLAKMLEPDTTASSALTMSPTMTARGTYVGMLLGTAAYMSPEQARGRPVDKRTDIWAFGCVLFEILTGKIVFAGEEVSDTLALIITKEPDWTSLPADLPPAVAKLLRRCLTKDRKQRLADIADARFEIDEMANATPGVAAIAPAARQGWLSAKVWRSVLTAAVIVVASAATGIVVWNAKRPGAPRLTRFTVLTPDSAALSVSGVGDLAITPDGSRVVYVAANGTRLFVRTMDELEPRPLFAAPTAARGPFVQPNGQWVGFFGSGQVQKVSITGGPALPVCQLDGASRGGTWGPDDTIIFATLSADTGLQRVSAAGGTPTTLTTPDREHGEGDHFWPEFLPSGHGVLFTITSRDGGPDTSKIAVVDLRTNKVKVLLTGGSEAHYVSSGHLVYTAANAFRAVGFDLNRLEVAGTPVPVQQTFTDLAIAADGTLAYVPGPRVGLFAGAPRTLVWVDRQGHEQPIKAPARPYVYPRLSPDGTRIAAEIRDREIGIWIFDLRHETLTPLTGGTGDSYPVWTADGQRIVYNSRRNGPANLFSQAFDGTGPVERLTDSPNLQNAYAVSGTQLLFLEDAGSRVLVMTLALDSKDHRVQPLLSQLTGTQRNFEVSPDGRWLAYDSIEKESDERQIYVRPFRDPNSARYQVSTTGGRQPLWSRSLVGQQELFYLGNNGELMRVTVERSTTWQPGNPTKLFSIQSLFLGPQGRTYDVSPDGKRFLMIKSEEGARPRSFVIIQNWTEELKRLVPVK